jgi:nicotinamide riboside transporter PnuC
MKVALQIIALCCTRGGIILTANKRRSCWLVYEVGGFAWITLYIMSGLYIAIIAQAVFLVMNIFGWVKWGKDKHIGRIDIRKEWFE